MMLPGICKKSDQRSAAGLGRCTGLTRVLSGLWLSACCKDWLYCAHPRSATTGRWCEETWSPNPGTASQTTFPWSVCTSSVLVVHFSPQITTRQLHSNCTPSTSSTRNTDGFVQHLTMTLITDTRCVHTWSLFLPHHCCTDRCLTWLSGDARWHSPCFCTLS